MFETLARIAARPEPFSRYTTPELWNDPYISRRMLELHLDPDVDRASRGKGWHKVKDHSTVDPGNCRDQHGCKPELCQTDEIHHIMDKQSKK